MKFNKFLNKDGEKTSYIQATIVWVLPHDKQEAIKLIQKELSSTILKGGTLVYSVKALKPKEISKIKMK
jgi:hypothetical protein